MCRSYHRGITTIPKYGMLGVTEFSYYFWYDIHTSFFTVWDQQIVIIMDYLTRWVVRGGISFGAPALTFNHPVACRFNTRVAYRFNSFVVQTTNETNVVLLSY